jgi:hypothetical protein
MINPAPVSEVLARLGDLESMSFGIGILAMVGTVVFMVPRTSVLGAVLPTGYLGAFGCQMRIDSWHFSIGFSILFGMLIWCSLLLRDAGLRPYAPSRR